MEGDHAEIEFPEEFVFPEESELSAIYQSTYNSVVQSKAAYLTVYPSINKIFVYMPDFFNVVGCSGFNNCQLVILISGLR